MGSLAANTPRFMHEEALDVLPALLDRLGIERPLLIGHSDGASIALIHAAASGRPVRGLVLMAPHVFVEPICLESIARIRDTYFNTDLKQRLAKHHAHVDDAFLGWADTWLLPEFRSWSIEDLLPAVHQPMLLIQGRDDAYGTLAQLDRIEAGVQGLRLAARARRLRPLAPARPGSGRAAGHCHVCRQPLARRRRLTIEAMHGSRNGARGRAAGIRGVRVISSWMSFC